MDEPSLTKSGGPKICRLFNENRPMENLRSTSIHILIPTSKRNHLKYYKYLALTWTTWGSQPTSGWLRRVVKVKSRNFSYFKLFNLDVSLKICILVLPRFFIGLFLLHMWHTLRPLNLVSEGQSTSKSCLNSVFSYW